MPAQARLRPGRQLLQRKHREENMLTNRDALDYLREIGVDRVACMVIMAKVRRRPTHHATSHPALLHVTDPTSPPLRFQASEYLFYQKHSEGAEEEDCDTLTKEQVVTVVQWLRDAGVPPSQLPAVVSAHPTLLAYDVETRLKPLSDYLSELGVPGERLATALQERPSLLGLSANRNMRVMVDYLLSTGKPLDECIELLLRSL